MKKILVLTALILAPILMLAQRYRTVELKPITKQGWKYFYDLKKVSSPIALEVPLMSLEDPEINRFVKSSKAWRTAGVIVSFAPVIYLISLDKHTYVDQSTFWWIFGGTILAQIGLEAIGHVQFGKGIDKYNRLVLLPSGSSLGLQATWKFR